MKLTTLCLAFVTALVISDCAHGQLLKNLFGGGNSSQHTPLGVDASTLEQASKLLGQQKFQVPGISSLLGQQGAQGNTAGQGGLSNLSKLIPTPQLPSFQPPNLLNQFNAKSKEMIDRTTEWARGKQQEFKEKSFGRLAKSNPLSFLSGLSGNTQATGNPQAGSATRNPLNNSGPSTPNVPAQPQIRSAANPNGQPTVRF